MRAAARVVCALADPRERWLRGLNEGRCADRGSADALTRALSMPQSGRGGSRILQAGPK